MKRIWLVNKVNASTAELLVYGYIGDEVVAASFTAELKELEKEYANINIRINSCGGGIFDGFAIYNAIKNCKCVIDTYIDGVAASMGTVIALAGRKIYMSKVATFMTHRASSFAMGSADDLRTTADMMEGLEDSICAIYAKRTGLTKEEAKAKYFTGEDRWLTAQQCLDEKLIDGIYDAESVELPAKAPANELHGIYNQVLQQPINKDMAKIILSLTAATTLGIPADGVEAPILEAKITELANRATTAETAKKKAEDDLADFKKNAAKDQVKNILDKALTDKKTTVAYNTVLAEQYAGNPEGLQKVVDVMPAYQGITDALNTSVGGELPEKFKGKTYDDLHTSGDLGELKAKHPDTYKAVYKDKFGKEPA